MSEYPSGWMQRQLGEFCECITKGTTPGEYTEKGVNFVKVESVSPEGKLIESKFAKITRQEHNKLRRSQLEEGDILLSIAGTLGRVASIGKEHLPANTNQALAIVRLTSGAADLQYCLHLLASKAVQAHLQSLQTIGAQPNLSLQQVSEIPLALPPLPEQKKIAEILSGIDQAIAKLIHKSQKLDALQASLTEEFVQELQGKMDLAELQEQAEVRTGVAKNAKSEGDMTEMPYMRVANVQDGYLDLSEIKTISVDRGRIQRYLLQSGDVLINEGGDLDKVGRGVIWRGEIKECLHQNHVFAVRCSERLTPEFLSLLLKSAYSKNYSLGCVKQTTNLASINSTQLKQFPIPVPDLRTQGQFISNITAVKELNSAITSEISGLEATKKAVASELLSGRKRVSV